MRRPLSASIATVVARLLAAAVAGARAPTVAAPLASRPCFTAGGTRRLGGPAR